MIKFSNAVAVAVLVVATAGCSHGGGGEYAGGGGPTASSSHPSATLPVHGSHAIQMVRVGSMRFTNANVGPLALDGQRVAFPYAAGQGRNWDEVVLFDASASGPTHLARTEFAQGLINWVAVSGNWVTWVDQSRRQSDSEPNVLWRVHALNTQTGATRLLASNGRDRDPFVPVPRAGSGYFVWASAEPNRSARENVWRPGWSNTRVVLRHAAIAPGSETIVGNHLVYLGPPSISHHGQAPGGDCWTTSVRGGSKPAALTHSALAMGCAISADGQLVWNEHIDPQERPRPPDGILDDPFKIKTQTFPDLAANRDPAPSNVKPRLLHRGYISWGHPLAGSGFAAWEAANGRIAIHLLNSSEPALLLRGTDPLHVTTSGAHNFAYITHHDKSQTLTIGTIRLPTK